jgi:hypothetical protein
MPLSAGEQLGPYQIIAPLGAGGMGEVYRARDARLGREVALKVLPPEHASDAHRRERFEREAKAVAALEHPNILALHDVGSDHDRPYVVFELVEGQTLLQKLGRGPLPVRKAVEYAVQVCRGLAAAHSRGIVHRDLKPENLSLTADGQIKILDFGLARLSEVLHPGKDQTGSTATGPDVALGTVGYMSPEQVRGQPVDARSDLFSLGAVLYEMVSGRRAFDGATPADRTSAILFSDPPELTAGSESAPPQLVSIVRRCLEKDPDERFQSARDLAFALGSLAGSPASGAMSVEETLRRRRRRWWSAAALLGLAALAALGSWQVARRPAPLPSYQQLSFRRGMVLDARFTADGNTVVYSGLFDGTPAETYTIHLGRPESLRLDLPTARLAGVSSTGELAVVLGRPEPQMGKWRGMLARAPLTGGAPREVVDDVYGADWGPDGRELAAIRWVDGEYQLEYPVGRVLRRPVAPNNAWFAMRVSPDGSKVAYAEGPGVTIVDRSGGSSVLKAEPWPTGLAWNPSGDAIWAAIPGGMVSTSLWRLGLDGSRREAVRLPGIVMILDVARDGRQLVHVGFEREGIRARAPGETVERDLCPLIFCENPKLSADGTKLIFQDWSDQTASGWAYMRPTSGGAAVRLGEGLPLSLSADGRWALVEREGAPPSVGESTLILLPTGPGAPRLLNTHGLSKFGAWIRFVGSAWIARTSDVFVAAEGPNGGRRTYLITPDAQPTPVTPPGILGLAGPVGGYVLGAVQEGIPGGVPERERALAWYPIAGGEPRPTRGKLREGDNIAGLTDDGRCLFVGVAAVPGRIERLDLTSGLRTPWKTVQPEDLAGVVGMYRYAVTPDGRAYAYNYLRQLQDLFLIEGVR